MKVRIGFVSNSSSSSFVMVGVDMRHINYEEFKKKLVYKFGRRQKYANFDLKDLGIGECVEGFDDYNEADEGHYFGIHIAQSNDYGLDSFSFNFDEIAEKVEQIKKLFAEIGEPEVEVKLVGGQEES